MTISCFYLLGFARFFGFETDVYYTLFWAYVQENFGRFRIMKGQGTN